jgi:hypothetical protein
MTDNLVKRLKIRLEAWLEFEAEDDAKIDKEVIDRIEQLERALLDVAQYTSSVDMFHFVEPETRKVLNEIGGRKDDR